MRTDAAHLWQQAYRLLRLFALTLLGQVLAQLVATGDVTNLDRKTLVGLLVGAAETVYRQVVPTPAPPTDGPTPAAAAASSTGDTSPGDPIGPVDLPLVHDPAVHRLGKAMPRIDPRTLSLRRYATSSLPVPPASTQRARAVKSWGMLGNDELRDCTIAAAGHMVKLWTALAGHPARVLLAQIVAAYSAICGYVKGDPSTDQGGVELDVLNAWRKTGIAGHRIGAYAAVTVTDLHLVRQAIWLFDGLYIGLQLPKSAQTQQVWDVTTGPLALVGSWGGHAVDVVDYNQTGPVVVTWGQLKQMTWAFWLRYCDEAYAVLSQDALDGKLDRTAEGFDLAALQTELASLTAA